MPRQPADRIPLDDEIADNLYELFCVWSELADNKRLGDLRGPAAKIGILCHRVSWLRLEEALRRKAVRP